MSKVLLLWQVGLIANVKLHFSCVKLGFLNDIHIELIFTIILILQRDARSLDAESSDEEELLDEETLEVFDIVSKNLAQRAILPLSRRLGIRQTQVEDIEHRYVQ